MKNFLFVVLLCISGTGALFSQKSNAFRFNKNGQFKIVQFTDIHWKNDAINCAETARTIQAVLSTENPDIVILTGDVVSDPPIAEGWKSVARIFEEAQIPWLALMGNHDTESDRGFSRCDIAQLIENLPYYIQTEKPLKLGCGNYLIQIFGQIHDSVKSVLYCIDSHDYPVNKNWGHYDWIHFDQVDWYRNTSNSLTKSNGGEPLPSLAFFHIPLVEYNNIIGNPITVGTKGEGIASSDVNSGIFASMIEKQDIMGVFTGHDHENDFIGIEKNIALAFGRVTGANAYGKLERGARVIVLYEGRSQFDTWIRTKKGTELYYYYPSGISSVDEQELTFLPALKIKPNRTGVSYSYYEGRFKSVEDIATNKAKSKGVMKNFSIESAEVEDYFAFEFRAYIQIPERGVYRFYTNSDDGSRLYIDNQLVVDNDGSHELRRADGKVALEKGFHEIIVRYLENYMGQELEIGFSSRNIFEQLIPDNMLFVKE